MHLRLIQGGVADGERPIVWNRAPKAYPPTGASLILRDDVDPGVTLIAMDCGDPWLIGVRAVCHDDYGLPVLQAWIDHAKAEGMQLVDERGQGSTAISRSIAAQIRDVEAARQQRRRCEPLPTGSLFS